MIPLKQGLFIEYNIAKPQESLMYFILLHSNFHFSSCQLDKLHVHSSNLSKKRKMGKNYCYLSILVKELTNTATVRDEKIETHQSR